MSPHSHNMANFDPLTAENGWRVWGTPANFNGFRVLASLPEYYSDVAHRRRTKLYTFSEALAPLMEFCQVQSSLCVQVLRSPILDALLHGTPAAGVSQTFLRGTRTGITELSQTAAPIFGWAAITLGIGPHSS